MAEAVVEPAETKLEVQVPTRRTVQIGREMGLGAIFIFSISSIGLIYSGMLPFSTLAGMWPGSNLAGMILTGGGVTLILTYIFAAIGTIAPHFGADYVVASRIISPPLAFASSWTLAIFLAMAGGSVVTMVAQDLIPMFAGTFVKVMFDKSMESVVAWVSTPYGTITIGTAGVILLYLALITPSRVTLRFLFAGTVVGIAAWIVIGFILASTNVTIFQSSWERFMGEGAFISHLSQARSLGMTADYSVGTMLVAGVMLSLWVFSGAFNPVYFASEVRDPKKNLLGGSMIALLVAMAILTLSTILLQRLIPSEWLSAESYLSHTGGNTEAAMPWLPFYLAVLQPNGILIQILGVAAVISFLAMAHTFLYTSSRIMLAWGEDHLIPQYATFIHPELRSPLITVLIVCLLAEVGVMESALNTGINTRINPVFFFVGVEFLPVLGITLLPFRKREWFGRASGFLRARIGPLPLLSLVGGLGVLYLVAMIAALVIWPGYNPLNIDTLIWFGIMFASGLVWFFGRRFLLKKQGINIDPMLHSAPEE